MKTSNRLLVISLVLILSALNVPGQTGPHEMVQRMGRGINLGNTLSAPVEGNWSPPATEQYFIDVKNAGFTNVRIPIRFDTNTDISAPYTVNSAYLDRIEEVTGWALKHGLVAIIDVHGDHWFWDSYADNDPSTPTQETYDRFMAIWTQVSDRFKYKSENLLFEIMNEPYFSMSAQEVADVTSDALAIIRQTNPTRNVIVTGGGDNSYKAILAIDETILAADEYLIPTFHYYRPYNFTSSGKEAQDDNDWGTTSDKNQVDLEFDQVKAWATEHNVPVYLGEFGADNENGFNYNTGTAGSFGGPDKNSRIAYHKYIADAAISRGFAFAAWCSGPKSNKTIHLRSDNIVNATPGVWVQEILEVLIRETVTSIQEKKEALLNLYPNPASDMLFIDQLRTNHIVLTDTRGATIELATMGNGAIDISKVESGIYTVSVLTNDKHFKKKLIISR